ncbi:DHS-like NAD/FAD-binding domain-containing protein [Athelia psychrophila]|uniref:DHS-like NAD/FAD-binding domain-containing protein n=1 Tax=Athelia psychrophila TaxID=1759441 RepID=A0A166E219_9AGAM|nr:DHS-like NAD/FAD-binding domain-containing protein [Fibularhizoctonia sp. CBS 109695]
MAPSSDVQKFQDALASSKRIITLAGAGLSAGSGIPTYRDKGGLWGSNNAMECATPQAFQENPARVWQFYNARRVKFLEAKPNAAHIALASLSLPATCTRVAPGIETPPIVVTQNIDSLSRRALQSLLESEPQFQQPGAADTFLQATLFEIHGSMVVTQCTSCRHINRTDGIASPFAASDNEEVPGLPRCGGPSWAGSNRYGQCGGLLRPSVTWFGEVPEHMGEIAMRLNKCDMFLLVGTSSLVHPAAGFAKTVRACGGKIAVFNKEKLAEHEEADFLFLGPCEDTLLTALGLN